MTIVREVFALGQANGIWVVAHRGSEVSGLHAVLALADRPLTEAGRPRVVGGRRSATGRSARRPDPVSG
jgi:hypothetical protein